MTNVGMTPLGADIIDTLSTGIIPVIMQNSQWSRGDNASQIFCLVKTICKMQLWFRLSRFV
jgi:hypothetical protein